MIYKYPYKGIFKVINPFKKAESKNFGVDLQGENKEIYPIACGFVQGINNKGTRFGNHILIKQDDGRVAFYAHLKSVNVELLQNVDFDTMLGTEGGKDRVSYLHLELHEDEFKIPKRSKNSSYILNPMLEIDKFLNHNAMKYFEILSDKGILEKPCEWSNFDDDLSTKTIGELLKLIAKSL